MEFEEGTNTGTSRGKKINTGDEESREDHQPTHGRTQTWQRRGKLKIQTDKQVPSYDWGIEGGTEKVNKQTLRRGQTSRQGEININQGTNTVRGRETAAERYPVDFGRERK